MIMMALLLNRNLSIKTTMNSIKLSTCLLQGRTRENILEICGIESLDGTFAITRSTLFLEDT
jgi:hypothetical protein